VDDRGAETLRRFHDRTKHSYESVRVRGRGLDWANEPSKVKSYRVGEPIELPRPAPVEAAAVDALAGSSGGETNLDLEVLASLLFLTAGVHRIIRGPGGSYEFRTYASAGALYPNEVYVAAADLPGLPAGLYHYHPRDHTLRRLRDHDARQALAEAAARPSMRRAPAVLALTGIPWRTAWKYGTRGYRHLWWDAGMMLANLLTSAEGCGIVAEIVTGFVDRDVDRVLGIDGNEEMSLALAPVGQGAPEVGTVEAAPIHPAVAPLSAHPERDPEIEGAHRASALDTRDTVARWRDLPVWSGPVVNGDVAEIAPLAADRRSRDAVAEVIPRRGSTRRLAREAIPAEELRTILDLGMASISGDAPAPPLAPFVVANAVTGLEPGAYRYAGEGRFERRRPGDLHREAGYVCLEQRLGADAAATVFLMTELDPVLERLGGRGYRVAQLHGGIAAGRLYLAAYAQCLGASGITFYDDAASELFQAPTWRPLLAVVLGREGTRSSIIRCRERR
jgi:SagB-type dehydrogenase family enzyme